MAAPKRIFVAPQTLSGILHLTFIWLHYLQVSIDGIRIIRSQHHARLELPAHGSKRKAGTVLGVHAHGGVPQNRLRPRGGHRDELLICARVHISGYHQRCTHVTPARRHNYTHRTITTTL